MTSTHVLRPTSGWQIVRHPGGYFSSEAVMQTKVEGRRGITHICEIRLTNDDVMALLQLPEVQEMAKQVMAGESAGTGEQS